MLSVIHTSLFRGEPYLYEDFGGWKIYDLENQKLLSDEEFNDIIPYGDYSCLLKSAQGEKYLNIPRMYSRFSDRGDSVITSDTHL